MVPKIQASSRVTPDFLPHSFQASQHALEIFRRSLPNNDQRQRLDRLANRLTKIHTEIRKLKTT
jgi:hypothetical protein